MCLVVAALVVGFGLTTLVLNLTDKGSQSVSLAPGTITPGTTTPGTSTPGTTPTGDPDESVLGGIIVNQNDVPAADTVHHPADGINMAAPTLDLCNGRFPSEAHRTARRQVYVGLTATPDDTSFSTEAVLYASPADGAQAMREIQAVVAACPASPVVSPVGEPTVITKFSAPPDKTWPRSPTVQRQAYAFVTTDQQSGDAEPGIAVYLRRGRVLMGLYFAQPTGAQIPIDGHSTLQQIVSVFESRIAHLPAAVVNR